MSENAYWDPETGAACPVCGAEKAPVTSSPPEIDGIKTRYHQCQCGAKFKSIQVSKQRKLAELGKLDRIAEDVEKERELLSRILNYS